MEIPRRPSHTNQPSPCNHQTLPSCIATPQQRSARAITASRSRKSARLSLYNRPRCSVHHELMASAGIRDRARAAPSSYAYFRAVGATKRASARLQDDYRACGAAAGGSRVPRLARSLITERGTYPRASERVLARD